MTENEKKKVKDIFPYWSWGYQMVIFGDLMCPHRKKIIIPTVQKNIIKMFNLNFMEI